MDKEGEIIMAMLTMAKEIAWKGIQEAVNRGEAGNFKPGQIVTDILKDGREMPYVVVATNHYRRDEIIFTNKVSYGNHCMSKSGKNNCGWSGSNMRKYANTEIFDLLPDDLQAVIASRAIIELNKKQEKVESIDKLWCLSQMEVSGSWYGATDNGEDKQFPYFTEWANRILLNEDGDKDIWWERSPAVSSSHNFCVVYAGGCPYSYGRSAGVQFGVRLGFLIRKSK